MCWPWLSAGCDDAMPSHILGHAHAHPHPHPHAVVRAKGTDTCNTHAQTRTCRATGVMGRGWTCTGHCGLAVHSCVACMYVCACRRIHHCDLMDGRLRCTHTHACIACDTPQHSSMAPQHVHVLAGSHSLGDLACVCMFVYVCVCVCVCVCIYIYISISRW